MSWRWAPLQRSVKDLPSGQSPFRGESGVMAASKAGEAL
jgi:hypothetical protein